MSTTVGDYGPRLGVSTIGSKARAESSYIGGMAEAYSLKWFLLNAKQEFLRAFFHRGGLLLDIPFAGLEDGQADLVFDAIQALTRDQREASEACFQDIFQMANRAGVDAIIAASRSTQLNRQGNSDLVQHLGGMASYLDRAFWTYLHRPQYWEFACLFADADATNSAWWVKHPKVPRKAPRLGDKTVTSFAGALGHYFHTMEGRGDRCEVKLCDRGDSLYAFCFLEQPSRADPEWRPEGLRRRTFKPAQPLTFMYSQAVGELDTYLRAKPRVVWDVMAIFAQHILGVKKLEPPPKHRAVYHLESFKRRGMVYKYGQESGISLVAVRKLRLTPKFGPKRHIFVEGTPVPGSEPVYDALEQHLSSISVDDVEVTQVELKVVFGRTTYRRKRTLSPTISVPNRCSLGYDDLELIVRKMLIASGIELKEDTEQGAGLQC